MVAQGSTFEISSQMMVPELLSRHPEARAVLDRYGLRGCGGPSGPHESLAFFARMHGVGERALLHELREVIDEGTGESSLPAPSVADTIYRRFFVAGIVATLTAGAAWGVWLLWQIGLAETFTGVSIHSVNAHGHAQIFGWVGLFIMGFAYQALPRFWQASLAAPRLAVVAFVMMLIGITTVTTATWLHDRPWAAEVALGGALVELGAILLFAGQVWMTFSRASARVEPHAAFVLTALAFFVLQAAFGAWHGWTTMTAGTRDEVVYYVRTYQAVLRDLQIHGLALFMILGVSLRLLPGAYGLPQISRRRGWMAYGMLVAGVVGECVLFIAYGWTGHHAFAGALLLPWLLLAVGALIVPWTWRLWRPLESGDRSAKFIRAGYGWLAVSMLMLLLLPVYGLASGLPFSHAYYGAIRHAITVGFISLMIMGVAAKVVPTLNGIDMRQLSELWGPFVLVNTGCFLRITLQTLTDWHPVFFPVVGISGVLELSGLAWWGLHLVGIMRRGKRRERAILTGYVDPDDSALSVISAVGAAAVPVKIEPGHHVADVLRWFPQTEEVLVSLGFGLIRNPLLRRTVARQTTLAQAAAMRGVPLELMLDKLNQATGRAQGTAQAVGAGVSYGTRVAELLERAPQVRAALLAMGIDPATHGALRLDDAATAVGLEREQLVFVIAQAMLRDGKSCSGACDTCDNHAHGKTACSGASTTEGEHLAASPACGHSTPQAIAEVNG